MSNEVILALISAGMTILGGLAFCVRWILKRIDTLEQEKSELYAKMMDKVLPAVGATTALVEKVMTHQKELAETRQALMAKMEATNQTQAEIIANQQTVIAALKEAQALMTDLHKQEIAIARRKGGGG